MLFGSQQELNVFLRQQRCDFLGHLPGKTSRINKTGDFSCSELALKEREDGKSIRGIIFVFPS